MNPLSIAALAAASCLPLWSLLSLRALLSWRALDGLSRRRLRRRSLVFGVASYAIAIPLCALKGSLAWPVLFEVLVAAVAIVVLCRLALALAGKATSAWPR